MSLPESKYSVRFAWAIQPGANGRPKLNQVISCPGKHLWPNCWTSHWSNCSSILPTQPVILVFGLTFLSWSLNGSGAGRAHILITPKVNSTSARPFYCYEKLVQTPPFGVESTGRPTLGPGKIELRLARKAIYCIQTLIWVWKCL